MIVEFRGIRSCGAPEAAHRNLRIPNAFVGIDPSRHNAAVVFEGGVCCSHTAVARKSHGSRSPNCQFRKCRASCVRGCGTPRACPQLKPCWLLPRHPLPLPRQHVLPRDEPHPALALGFFLVRHLAHVDGVAPARVLHRALVVLGRVVVDVVVWVVRRRVVAVVPC